MVEAAPARRREMSEVSERYARRGEEFADKGAAVPDGKWESPSPCEGWTARDVVRHVVQTQGMFLGFIGRELGDLPSLAADPAPGWNAPRAVVQANLDDPEVAATEFDGFTGRST